MIDNNELVDTELTHIIIEIFIDPKSVPLGTYGPVPNVRTESNAL